MKRLDKVLLDADICFKLGRFISSQFIARIIPHVADEVFIHEYVYERELMTNVTGKPQLEVLVKANVITVLEEGQLSVSDKESYNSTVELLCQVMKGKNSFYDNEHRGEIVSLAMAKTVGIPIFMTDEKNLQPIIDSKLNTGVGNDIHVFRLIDLILFIKSNLNKEIKRKEARSLWCGSYDKKYFETNKLKFDNEIWQPKCMN